MPINKIDKILARSPSSGGTLQKLLRNREEKAHLTSVLRNSLPILERRYKKRQEKRNNPACRVPEFLDRNQHSL